ncbi:MAG: histidine triad nucleotide-binding protein [Akkermansiaceae bacterium]
MSERTLFEKIIAREIPADIVYEDDLCLCFRDISPQAPTHLLLIPKRPIPRIAQASAADQETLGHMMLKVGEIARSQGFAEDGFRTVINNGAHGGEAVPHLHLHLLAGRQMQWPPG